MMQHDANKRALLEGFGVVLDGFKEMVSDDFRVTANWG